ncbi:CocE/NonD family hydrolase [Saccharomonospora piscinae]|uniref:CocE/NonD family hydrolase n=1 Tax=Saccharomonospora piscinae TaxID=687388 RepID=UPI000463A381|nr:CocE/NonD family hydrolase [Saccharomonospora piscinae]
MTGGRGEPHVCRMRDGTELHGRFWACAHPEGVVVIRTPYDADAHASTARSWNARGYHCLVQDVRGRYRSQGAWEPFRHEESDGGPVLLRLGADHPGLPVLLFGASYAAHTALEAARAAARTRPAVVAGIIVLVPALGLAETAWDSTGAPRLRQRIGWWHEHGRARRSRPALPAAELDRRTAQAAKAGVLDAATSWGWSAETVASWRRLWAADRVDLAARYGLLDLPLLVISGDDDFFDADARRLARAWPGASHFATGPWGHTLAAGVTDPAVRAGIRRAGGLARLIDGWLSARGLPGNPEESAEPAGWAGSPTRSRLDPEAATWQHERATP